MGKQNLDNAIRNEFIEKISRFLTSEYDTDVMPIDASKIVIPVVDAEGNEKFCRITIEVPRGTRNGNGGYNAYDGYKLAELYKEDCEIKAKEAQERAEAKAKEEAEKERKREERKKKKEMESAE